MSVKLLNEHYLKFLSLKAVCPGSSESTLVKIPHCWKSHVAAQVYFSFPCCTNFVYCLIEFDSFCLHSQIRLLLFCLLYLFYLLTLNAPIATKVVCFSRLLKCLKSLYGKQCGPRSDCIGAVCSGSTLFASILNLSVMLGNYLQQTITADDIFRCIFSCRFKG